jgi:ABC-type nitrate/sulfonate/bicarbonate transport system ATPase subunit
VTLNVLVSNKSFSKNQNATQIISDVDFVVPDSAIVCLYGPSGCGKSTLLRIIAGLDAEYEGEVELDGVQVNRPTKKIGLTVQTHVSYDWLTVAGNITFGLKYAASKENENRFRRFLGKVPRDCAAAEARRLAAIVGLSEDDLEKYPEEISGGMKQRMAFARALLTNPKVLLLDEPFSSLDFESRQSMQEVVLRVRQQLGTAFVCVSHDPEEVLYLADEILIMSGRPARIVHRWSPTLPHKQDAEKRYSPEFQQAKKYLQGWLNGSEPQ